MVDGFEFSIDRRVASVIFNRPDRYNLLTQDVLQGLCDVAQNLASNSEVDVLTLTSQGPDCFSFGILNPQLRASLSKPDVLALIRLANTAFDAIEALPQIVIAGLNGEVRAGAVELALACDIRIAGAHVRSSSPEAKWGGFPGVGAPVRLPAIIGMGRALELLCTGREIDAPEMERIGLVEHVVPRDEVHARLVKLAQTIAENGPLATKGVKRIANMRATSGFRAARDLSDDLRAKLEWTNDIDEGIAAALESRKPIFTGR